MKVKVKLEQICVTTPDGRAPFIEALRAVRRLSLPAKTFYWLNKISTLLESEFKDYETARVHLIMKLGVKSGDGYQVGPENKAAFDKEMAELNLEVELPIDEGVKLELPTVGVAEDWFLLMGFMDIFAEPA
jgi:hypothetical protein